nr:hypothetical protein Iba_chr01bCG14470 [Ipomoea batatas]GMC54039.1 hypothetical protein Iba_chr01dCG12360 [Ipomoea batatas]GMC54769.1 hypothetical protein Iba_chr01eCG1050 [Ipomoea batatas]GMC55889.1 hypothetical protein Iba_chr01fCG1930 [Ipomoea batatas]
MCICWIIALMIGCFCNVLQWCITGAQEQLLLALELRARQLWYLSLGTNLFGVIVYMLGE